MVHDVNRGAIGGSFVIATYKQEKDGKKTLLGYESILNRWHTSGCANCQTHLKVKVFIPLHGVTGDDLKHGSGVKIVPAIIPRVNSDGKLLVGGGKIPKPQYKPLKTGANQELET